MFLKCPTCGMEFDSSVKRCPRDGASIVDWTEERTSTVDTGNKATGVPVELTAQTACCPACGMVVDLQIESCPRDGTPINPLTTDPQLRKKYQFLEKLGRGGMGVMYKTHQTHPTQTVAIKMLHHSLQDQEELCRFQIEGRATSLLSHPGIITIHDFGTTTNNQPYMVMDFVEGLTLSQIIQQDKCLALPRFLELFEQICAALEHAHQHKILHRDIKPSNIMIVRTQKNAESRELIRLMDFGIAKLLDGNDNNIRGADKLTRTGAVIGSPLYMSPEQARGEPVDTRSDLYSLGCVMYEAMLGQPPFRGETAMDTMLMHMDEPPLLMSKKTVALKLNIKIDPACDQMVLRLLQKQPDDRYQSASELRAALQKLISDLSANRRLTLPSPASPPGVFGRESSNFWQRINYKKAGAIGAVLFLALAGGISVWRLIELQAPSNLETDGAQTGNLAANTMQKPAEASATGHSSEIDQSLLEAETIDLWPLIKQRDLQKNPIKDADLAPLRSATKAKSIIIPRAYVTDHVFSYLANLKQLERLGLPSTEIRDLSGIERLTNLKELDLSNTYLTKTGVQRLKSLHNLVKLKLAGTTISGADLQSLNELKHLSLLDISGCSDVSSDDCDRLLKRHPNMNIIR